MYSRNIEKLSRMARLCNCSIFVKNGPAYAGLGEGGEGYSLVHDRQPDGRGSDRPAQLLARAALRRRGPVQDHMSTPPAIAVFEFDSIAVGTCTADAMVKKAPINAFRIGTVQPGKYLVLIGGSVADVDESRREGLRIGGERVTDEIFPARRSHPGVCGHRRAAAGKRRRCARHPRNVGDSDQRGRRGQGREDRRGDHRRDSARRRAGR